MNECVFCNLVNNELPSWIIYEDENVICFLPLEAEAFGHTLIAPKTHYADLFSVPAETLNCILEVAQKVALHYQTAIGAAGVNLLHASGIEAQQSVLHFHIHLIPRFENDGLNAWPKLSKVQTDKDELIRKLRL
jgi:histidine triad (HIT) family protein